MSKLRQTLLNEIISSKGIFQNKYTNCYNSLRAVIELESKQVKDKLPKRLFDEFNQIKAQLSNIGPHTKGIPLLILEQYFFRNNKNLGRELFIEYNYKTKLNENKVIECEIYVTDLYSELERFFNEMYMLAIEISDYYNLEIKLKDDRDMGLESESYM